MFCHSKESVVWFSVGKLNSFLAHGCPETPKKGMSEDSDSDDEEISQLVKNLSYPGKLNEQNPRMRRLIIFLVCLQVNRKGIIIFDFCRFSFNKIYDMECLLDCPHPQIFFLRRLNLV